MILVQWLSPPPTDPKTTTPEIIRYLQQFKQNLHAPYVHEHPLRYPDGKSKNDWDHPDDLAYCDTFSEFWSSNHRGKTTWIGYVSTWSVNYVANPYWGDYDWHAWGVALISSRRGSGKHLIIWDCDPRDVTDAQYGSKRPQEFLLSTQLAFLKRTINRGRLSSFWYNTDITLTGQGLCLQHTLRWIHEIAQFGDQPFCDTKDGVDPRTKGCIKITRK